jgi:hypothetical protein
MFFFLLIIFILQLYDIFRSLDKAAPELVAQGRSKDIWWTRALVHNGLGIYATWTSIATLLNLAMVISYSSGSNVSG